MAGMAGDLPEEGVLSSINRDFIDDTRYAFSIMNLDDKARSLAKHYKQSEAELFSVLVEMDTSRLFSRLGFKGIYDYCFTALKLGESQSAYFQKVVRKSQEVPELGAAIQEGKITLSQARRIVPSVTKDNPQEWIEAARTLPQRELERKVTSANPQLVVRERLRPVAPTRTELRVGISVDLEKKLRRLQDILGGTLEEVLEKAVGETLQRRDPIQKAERAFLRKGGPSIKNAIHWRDGGCTQPGCNEQRYLQVHHIKPRAQGGSEAPENLQVLCSAHHRMRHLSEAEEALK